MDVFGLAKKVFLKKTKDLKKIPTAYPNLPSEQIAGTNKSGGGYPP